MANRTRNDLSIYDTAAEQWWSDDIRWVRVLKAMVPGRLRWFDGHAEWPGARVLDLGCAGGFMAEALAWRGAEVTGIDPAGKAIEAARVHAAQEQLDISYDIGTGEDLPYADAAFDAVVCVDVLEHVRDLRRVLSETARVLRPGGRFFFDTINRNPLSRLAVVTIGEDVLHLLPKGTHDPTKFITPRELIEGLEAEGFQPGPTTGLGPRGIDRSGIPIFGPLPIRTIIFMGVADKPGIAASVFGPLAEANINVDMIVQNVSVEEGRTDMTFTVTESDLKAAVKVLESKLEELGYQRLLSDPDVVKVSVIGVGMRSHAGVAQSMFTALAEKGINIQVISTSEIKISVLISEEYTELALRALHSAYGLDAV